MMLLGGLAALVPIGIHLIDRARARPHKFAALEFLFLSDKRLARRLKLRQLLVLTLRVLLLLAIPLALAKPFLTPTDTVQTSLSSPGSVVIVIDDSASMGAIPGDGSGAGAGQSLIAKAVARARELVAAGGDRTNYAIVTASAPARLVTSALTYERQALERALGDIAARPRRSDLGGALREAERVLAQSREPRRRVIVLTDSAATAWEGVTQPWTLDRIPEAEVIDVRAGATIDNVAVSGVKVRVAPERGPGAVEIAVALKNYGAAPTEATITVEIAGRTLVAKQTLAPGARVKRRFVEKLPLQQVEGARGVARVEAPGDGFALDNRWFFILETGESASVALVNGAPRTTRWADELFFCRAALAPDEGALPKVRHTVLSPDDLTKASLDLYDVVVLANLGRLSAAQRLTLENYVNKGGGLLVTAGERLTPEAAASFGDLLPYAIRGIKTVVRRDDPSAPLKALKVAQVDSDHPALADFGSIDDASLFKAQVYAYALVDNARRGARVVMGLSGGVPVLVEGALGRGRTMLLTTTIDRDWTDLPIRSSFVPFLQRTLLYLAGRTGDQAGRAALVGDMMPIPPPGGDGAVTLTRPDGETRDLGDEAVEEYMVAGTDVVGHYALTRRGGKAAVTFAINADRVESDFAPADPVKIAALMRKPGTGTVPEGEDGSQMSSASGGQASALPPNRTKVWPVVLVMLFFLLASEAWFVLRT